MQRASARPLSLLGLLAVIGEGGCIVRHLEFDQYPEKHLFVIVQRANG